MHVAAIFGQFATDWGLNRRKLLHVWPQVVRVRLSAITRLTPLGRQHFPMTLQEQIVELKYSDNTLKIKRLYATIIRSDAYPTEPRVDPSKLMRRYL